MKYLAASRPRKGTDIGARGKSEEVAVLHEDPNYQEHRRRQKLPSRALMALSSQRRRSPREMPYQAHEGDWQTRIFSAARPASPRETDDRRTWSAGSYVGDPWLTESREERTHGEI